MPSNRSKYRAVPTVVDGIRFASKREAKRYQDLKLLERAGQIAGLVYDKKQLRWPLAVNGELICTYEADFSYWVHVDGKTLKVIIRGNIIETADVGKVRKVIEDSKGFKTPAYRLKRKLMKAIHGIEIKEV
jgi:ribosomal protein L25 (general stress protein Ctc)